MRPVVTPLEMAAIDAAAPVPVETLIERAGMAVAGEARSMLAGCPHGRVLVVAGKGNNGADGKAAARRLIADGLAVEVLDAAHLPSRFPEADLIIDAAYGTGFRGGWSPPPLDPSTPVLAVDIPSGIDGATGERFGQPWRADRTVTFAAVKSGLLLGAGPEYSGEITVADIGLDVSESTVGWMDDSAAAVLLPRRARDAHKWRSAAWLIAGSPGMAGAASLAAGSAMRSGAGYLRLSTPGSGLVPGEPIEAVGYELPADRWAGVVLDEASRFAALGVGPGLGRAPERLAQVRELAEAPVRPPLVIDGDGLHGIVGAAFKQPTVLTPHDGELEVLGADPIAADRIGQVRRLAERFNAVVLAKGPTTVVAGPDGRVLLVTTGDQRLATAGTGDVLTGIILGFLAAGLEPLDAASLGAHVHGLAALSRPAWGLVASDLASALPSILVGLDRPLRRPAMGSSWPRG